MENTEETTALVLPEKLNEIATTSGLDVQRAIEHAFKFVPQMKDINELSKGLSIMDKENPSAIDVKSARTNRLALVKVRSAAKAVKDELKEGIITEGKLIDKLFNTVINTAELSEKEYEEIEKFAENKERERVEKIKSERLNQIKEYTEQGSMYPLGEMTEDNFKELLSGFKLAKEAKEAALIKAEEERIAREKLEVEEREAMRLENERLKAEAEETERLAKVEREKQAAALAKLEAEKKAEQDRHDKLMESQRKEAEKIKAENDAKLKKQQEETDRLAKELKSKKDAEELAKKDAKKKSEREEAERLAAEKKAAKAPDKEKLKKFISEFVIPAQVSGLGAEALIAESDIIKRFNSFKSWAEGVAENI